MQQMIRSGSRWILCLLLLLVGCDDYRVKPTQLQQILARGELRVGTTYSATTYYHGLQAPEGPEYELAKAFADYLGVSLKIVPVHHLDTLFNRFDNDEFDLLAAGLAVTEQRRQRYRFGPAYLRVSQKLVFRKGTPWPRDITQLNGSLVVPARSAFEEVLVELKQTYPELSWQASKGDASENLLEAVLSGEIDYTVADSSLLDATRRFHPELSIAFSLTQDDPIAWAVRQGKDDTLYSLMLAFFSQQREAGVLTQLSEKYFEHIDEFDYVDTRAFIRAVNRKLPKYRGLFEQYAQDIDWRLLAAQSYQESHWQPKATSRTGVRGMMMLTNATAAMLGITERTDPEQSIQGGARYLRQLYKRIPDQVTADERIWFALAAYNVGLGHVMDAADITEQRGGNRYRWADVKENLPLLTKRKWYRKTRYGYARGREPVTYVDNIRRYYETLVWLENKKAQDLRLAEQQKRFDTIPSASFIQLSEERLQALGAGSESEKAD